MINKRKAELLAPAGSFDSLKAAVAAGADAIYMGGSRFGARAYAQNAAGEEMVEAIRYAHLHGCRLYMTVNTLFKEKELDELCDYMKPYYEAGLDGVIVQDLGASGNETGFSGNGASCKHPDDGYQCIQRKNVKRNGLLPRRSGQRIVFRRDFPYLQRNGNGY